MEHVTLGFIFNGEIIHNPPIVKLTFLDMTNGLWVAYIQTKRRHK